MIFNWRFVSSATDAHGEIQSDWTTSTFNIAASKLPRYLTVKYLNAKMNKETLSYWMGNRKIVINNAALLKISCRFSVVLQNQHEQMGIDIKLKTRTNILSSLKPRQNGRHFADDIFKCIFLNENMWISINISLNFVSKGPIKNIPSLVQIMTWRRPGDKPLSEPVMVN